MKNFALALALLIFVGVNSLQATLPKAATSTTLRVSHSSSNAFWKGGEALDIANGHGSLSFLSTQLDVGYGLKDNLQMNLFISATESKLSEPFSNRTDKNQNSIADISEVGILFSKKKFSNSQREYHYTLGIIAPGFNRPNPDDFIAINDGAMKYELGITKSRFFSDRFNLFSSIKYRHRSGAPADQFVYDLVLTYYQSQKWSYGLIGNFLYTFGGFDLSSEEFKSVLPENPPFSELHVREVGLGLHSNYHYSKWSSGSIYVHKTVDGNNTDQALTLGLSYTLTCNCR